MGNRERAYLLAERKFLTEEELNELKGNEYVVEYEYYGRSESFNYYFYKFNILEEGYIPGDEEYQTRRYVICEKIEEEMED